MSNREIASILALGLAFAAPLRTRAATPAVPDAKTFPPAPSSDEFSPVIQADKPPEELSLNSALSRARFNHPDLKARRLQQELNEISYERSWWGLFLPQI